MTPALRSCPTIWFVLSSLALAACSAPEPKPNATRAGYSLEAREFNFCLPATEKSPTLVSGEAPIYPVNRLLAGEEGYAIIEFDVLEDGTTSNFAHIESSNSKFYAHTMHAVTDWRFTPAISGTSPKTVRCRFRQEFSTKNSLNWRRTPPD